MYNIFREGGGEEMETGIDMGEGCQASTSQNFKFIATHHIPLKI